MNDLVSVLVARKNELSRYSRETELVDELLAIHAPIPAVQKTQATVPMVAKKAASTKAKPATKKPGRPAVGSISQLDALQQVVRDNRGKTMSYTQLVSGALEVYRKSGAKVNKGTKNNIAAQLYQPGNTDRLGLKKTNVRGQYKCQPQKATRVPRGTK